MSDNNNKAELAKIWDAADKNPGIPQRIGRIVTCDFCDQDWTNRPESGGFIFGSKATCPNCAYDMAESISRYQEEHYIRARCPANVSFADFVRKYRGPDACIITISKPRRK